MQRMDSIQEYKENKEHKEVTSDQKLKKAIQYTKFLKSSIKSKKESQNKTNVKNEIFTQKKMYVPFFIQFQQQKERREAEKKVLEIKTALARVQNQIIKPQNTSPKKTINNFISKLNQQGDLRSTHIFLDNSMENLQQLRHKIKYPNNEIQTLYEKWMIEQTNLNKGRNKIKNLNQCKGLPINRSCSRQFKIQPWK